MSEGVMMDPAALEEMIFREVKKRLSDADISPDTNSSAHSILVVMNRIDPNTDIILSKLYELARSGISITLLVSRHVETIFREQGFASVEGIEVVWDTEIQHVLLNVGDYSTVLYPVMGFSLGRRLADLSDDDPLVQLATTALLSGVRVGVVTDGIESRGRNITSPEMNEISKRIKKGLSGIGIRLLTMRNLTNDLTTSTNIFGGKVVTEDTVIEYHRKDIWDMNVPRKVVITPLARDKAKELGMRINRME